MFWTFFLADLIADYPLQTDRLVVAKKRLPGLTFHVAIHCTVMTLLFLPVISIAWPYILAVAVFHFAIDAFKNLLGRYRPQWVISSYLLDQLLHIISLVLVSIWMARTTDLPIWHVTTPWIAYVIGLLLATYVWFVTERLLFLHDENLNARINATLWPRMGARLVIFLLIVAGSWLTWLLALSTIVIIAYLYGRINYPRWWVLLDIGVPFVAALIVHLILAV
jgi:hypothetical protein